MEKKTVVHAVIMARDVTISQPCTVHAEAIDNRAAGCQITQQSAGTIDAARQLKFLDQSPTGTSRGATTT